jgi:hypothetical protein
MISSRRLPRILFAYLLAGLTGYVVAIVFATSANLLNLRAVGAEIGVGDALRTYLFDLWGMTPRFEITRYGTVMLIGFAIAFPVAALLRQLALRAGPAMARAAPYLYPLAGATAIGTGLKIMYLQYEVTAVAGARGAGFWAPCLAGALAGLVFQRLLARRGA